MRQITSAHSPAHTRSKAHMRQHPAPASRHLCARLPTNAAYQTPPLHLRLVKFPSSATTTSSALQTRQMSSKKQRGKAAKISGKANVAGVSNSNQGKALDRAPIKPGHVSAGNSRFLKKLPREMSTSQNQHIHHLQAQVADTPRFGGGKPRNASSRMPVKCSRRFVDWRMSLRM